MTFGQSATSTLACVFVTHTAEGAGQSASGSIRVACEIGVQLLCLCTLLCNAMRKSVQRGVVFRCRGELLRIAARCQPTGIHHGVDCEAY